MIRHCPDTVSVYTLSVYTVSVYTISVYTVSVYTLSVYTVSVYTLSTWARTVPDAPDTFSSCPSVPASSLGLHNYSDRAGKNWIKNKRYYRVCAPTNVDYKPAFDCEMIPKEYRKIEL